MLYAASGDIWVHSISNVLKQTFSVPFWVFLAWFLWQWSLCRVSGLFFPCLQKYLLNLPPVEAKIKCEGGGSKVVRFLLVSGRLVIPERRVLCEDKAELSFVATNDITMIYIQIYTNDITSAVWCGQNFQFIGASSAAVVGFCFVLFLTQRSRPLKGAEVTALRRE